MKYFASFVKFNPLDKIPVPIFGDVIFSHPDEDISEALILQFKQKLKGAIPLSIIKIPNRKEQDHERGKPKTENPKIES